MLWNFGLRNNGERGDDDASSANITFVGVVYDHWIGRRIASQVQISLSLAALVRYDVAIIRQASRRDQIDGALKLGHRTQGRDDFRAQRFGW